MKHALAIALAIIATAAAATGQPKKMPHSGDQAASSSAAATAAASATSSSTSGASSAIDLSLMNAPTSAVDTSMRTGNTYVFPAPAAAPPLPSGLCPKGDSVAWSVVWGFVSYAASTTRTEHECLDKLLAYGRDTMPKPAAAPVVNYVAPVPKPAACQTPVNRSAAKVKRPQAPACVKVS